MATKKQQILHYLSTNRKWAPGVQLYIEIGLSQTYKRQINSARPTDSNKRLLHLTLGKESGMSPHRIHHILTLPLNHPDLEKYRIKPVQTKEIVSANINSGPAKTAEEIVLQLKERKQLSLREEFPFLEDTNCPDEFKILVSDLITDYHKAVKSHDALLSTPEEDLYAMANTTVEHYTNNKKAWAELENYKLNNTILGEHPIFKHKKLIDVLKELSQEQLVKKKMDIEKRSALRKSKLEFGDEPHLEAKRLEQNERDEYLMEVINELLKGSNE